MHYYLGVIQWELVLRALEDPLTANTRKEGFIFNFTEQIRYK